MINHFLSGEALKVLAAIPPAWWFWGWVTLYGLGAVFLLWVLTLVKNVFSWPGVIVLCVLLAYGWGFERAALHQPLNPFDNPVVRVTK